MEHQIGQSTSKTGLLGGRLADSANQALKRSKVDHFSILWTKTGPFCTGFNFYFIQLYIECIFIAKTATGTQKLVTVLVICSEEIS